MEHLVYCDFKSNELENLLCGKKTMIVRGSSMKKIPHGRVFREEILYFIENNGDKLIKAKGMVKSVYNSEKLTEEECKKLLAENQDKLILTNKQKQRWEGKKIICLIEVSNVEKLKQPLHFTLEKNMAHWITVEKIQDISEEG